MAHQFAHPSSRFWKALHVSGFTPRLLSPFEKAALLTLGLGLTNLVDRGTASARDLSQLRAGARLLESKVARHGPRWVACAVNPSPSVRLAAWGLALRKPRSRCGAGESSARNPTIGPMALNLAYTLVRFLADLLLVRLHSDAQLRAEVLALRHRLRVLERQARRSMWQPEDLL